MRMKVTGRDGVGGGAAKAFAGVFAFDAALGQGQAAGAHGAVFTADALDADGAGFHLGGTVEDRFDAQLLGPLIISWVPGSMDAATGSASLGFCCRFLLFFLLPLEVPPRIVYN
jgi:hypothetical protein